MGFNGIYTLVICYIAIENGHRNSGFTQLENGWIFHSYVTVYQRVWSMVNTLMVNNYYIIGASHPMVPLGIYNNHYNNPANAKLKLLYLIIYST